ncbi:MAG TPA: hypothetical protein VLH86_04580 [Patescibacteria group bacterium]|nr:hypothetical protein [Patescibacteria group bacterium]
MAVPDFAPRPIETSDTCAQIMREILSGVAMDLGDQVYPDSPLVHQIMDGQIPSATTEGPDGPTTVFWCEKYGGACNYSFLLTQPKAGLPPLLTEGAFEIHGSCMQTDNLLRAFQRARESLYERRKPATGTETATPANPDANPGQKAIADIKKVIKPITDDLETAEPSGAIGLLTGAIQSMSATLDGSSHAASQQMQAHVIRAEQHAENALFQLGVAINALRRYLEGT